MLRKEWLTKLGLALALAMLIVISYISFFSIGQFASSARAVSHTHLVIKQVNQVLAGVRDAESAQRGYLITGDQDFLDSHHAVVTRLATELATLRKLTNDNPTQRMEIDVLQELIDRRMHVLRLGIDTLANREQMASREIIDMVGGMGRRAMQQLQVQAGRMVAMEEKLLNERAQLVEAKAASSRAWILFGNMTAIALLASAFWLILLEVKHRKSAQRRTENAAAQLQLTNKELESFSYSVSHDLRSPLRAIDGYSRIFEEDYGDRLDEEGMRLLAVIRSSSKKMGQLIDDLLTFSRLGRKPVEVSRVDMNRLVEEVWNEVCLGAATNLSFKKEMLPNACADRSLLRQVLINLLSNAVKYSGKSAMPQIEVTAKERDQDVVYSVHDNGVGFDMRFYNKLFGVFQRLHTENEFPGTGVGLAIAQRVIVRHGGRIWAESTLGEHTVFHFSLPKEADA